MQGSLINRLSEQMIPSTPKVGDGATIYHYTDRSAGTVVEVLPGGKEVVVQIDKYTVVGNPYENRYEFEPDPNGRHWRFTLRKNGRWVQFREGLKNGTVVQFGARDKYHDFSF